MKWISVEDKLPDECFTDVLVYDEIENAQFIAFITNYNKWLVPKYEGCQFRITHWMPLPESPEIIEQIIRESE